MKIILGKFFLVKALQTKIRFSGIFEEFCSYCWTWNCM